MKKVIYSIVFFLLLACSLVACDMGDINVCIHEYGEWSTVKYANCTSEGQQRRACAKCQELETKKTEALGHLPEWVFIGDSRKEYRCQREGCGELVPHESYDSKGLLRDEDHHREGAFRIFDLLLTLSPSGQCLVSCP